MDHIAEVAAGIAYIPAGIIYGYLLLLPTATDKLTACLYEETYYWPHIIAIVAMLITVVLTNGLKLNYRKTQFIHLYLQLAATAFALTAGLVFLLVEDVVPAIYLGAIALGLMLVPGLSYLHIRARARHRALLMCLCTVWLLAGVATTATIAELASVGAAGEERLHQNVAIALLAASTLQLVLIGLVELLQRESIVDYRRPLDYDTAMAHDSGRLLNPDRRSFAPYAQFGRAAPALGKGMAAAGTGWSTERIVGGGQQAGEPGCRYRTLWTVYAVGTKLVGLLAFYWVLLVSGIAASRTVLEREDVGYLPFWLLVGGALLTTLLALRLAPKTAFVGASVLYVVALVLSVAFYCADLVELEYGISMLLFFAFLGAALPLPAISILELAPLNCNEAALALGTALELLAVALLQYYGVTMGDALFGVEQPAGGGDPVPASDHKGVIAAHYITAIVLGVVAAVATLWHVPNTGRKSLAEIESDLARMRSYFAFSRRHLASPAPAAPAATATALDETMVPPPPRDALAVGAPHHATNGRLADDALEELPVPPEQQLSARNAARFAALYPDSPDPRNGSYGSPASHSPNGRSRSPYNDFDRHYSPHQHQDAVQLQDALRRQHEANYLNARLLLQQQRAASGSPTGSGRALTPETIQPLPLLPVPLAGRAGPGQRPEPPLGSLTVKSEPGTMLRPALHTQKSDAPAPPPMPPADYLTKSLPRVKAVRQSRIPPIVPKPEPPAEVVVPGVEYSHNLVPSQFLRQSLQNSQLFR
ncbi:uncharacterized protein LOC121595287 [Anopheles merus]|uniref:uncharacterized protein LOC121595287 n=1 Tax=Anopheles merus TaxID=30066 RepID=UPI001BE49A18|nr:uncharacterized protein LOC121595287 [Anopheles merus]